MKKDITYFGEIEINSPQETTDGMVTIDNHQIRLDLNFYDGVPEHDWVAEYESYIRKQTNIRLCCIVVPTGGCLAGQLPYNL